MLTRNGSIISGIRFCLSVAESDEFSSTTEGEGTSSDNEKFCPSIQQDFIPSQNGKERGLSGEPFDAQRNFRDEQAPRMLSRSSNRPWIATVNFSDTCLDDPAFLAEVQSPTQFSSQLNLLPSPFTISPTKPSRPLSLVNDSPLKRSNTVANATPSFYSRSTSPPTILSYQFDPSSPRNSFSYTSKSNVHGSTALGTSSGLSKSKNQAAACQPNHMLRGGGTPIRPGSTPGMPPSAFWLYARAVQQRRNAILDLEAMTDPETSSLAAAAIALPDTQIISVSRPPNIEMSPTSKKERSCSGKHRIRQPSRRGSYERLRKDGGSVQRPPTWTGKEGLDRRLAAQARDSLCDLRGSTAESKAKMKLVKKRQP